MLITKQVTCQLKSKLCVNHKESYISIKKQVTCQTNSKLHVNQKIIKVYSDFFILNALFDALQYFLFEIVILKTKCVMHSQV